MKTNNSFHIDFLLKVFYNYITWGVRIYTTRGPNNISKDFEVY